jgi:ATP-binding cassette subfamily B protein
VNQTPPRNPKLQTWKYLWQLIRFRPWHYLALGIFETLFFGVFPQLVALITYAFFNTLTGDAPAKVGVYGLIALLIVTAVARVAAIFADVAVYFSFMYTLAALLRKNLFEHILRRPGARAVPGSPGEAISRFRGDVDEIANFMAESLILLGFGLFALIAVVVMLRINVRITLVVFLPLLIVIVAANLAMKNIEKYRQANRKATGNVTGFIGEMFGATQAVKVATAEPRVLERFRALNDTRRQAGLKDRLFNELLNSVFLNTVNIGTGVILLLTAQEMNAGAENASAFTVGDFALFVFYLGFVTEFTGLIGVRWAWYKQVGVSFERLTTLLEDAPPETLVRRGPVYMRGALPEIPYVPKTEAHHLGELSATGLTYRYPDTGRGIEDVNLHLMRGSFTVVTGRVGSGKTKQVRFAGMVQRSKTQILSLCRRVVLILPRCHCSLVSPSRITF